MMLPQLKLKSTVHTSSQKQKQSKLTVGVNNSEASVNKTLTDKCLHIWKGYLDTHNLFRSSPFVLNTDDMIFYFMTEIVIIYLGCMVLRYGLVIC